MKKLAAHINMINILGTLLKFSISQYSKWVHYYSN